MLGVENLSGFLAHFGLGSLTGIDIGGERKGILPSPEWKKARFKSPADQVWFPGETVIFGIGQGYLIVTPLQLAHMASILASRGKSYQPRLVNGLSRAGHGQDRADRAQTARDRSTSHQPENWQIVDRRHDQGDERLRHGLGAARQAREYQIAGKTGTAQVFTVAQNESYKHMEAQLDERLLDHGWFIAFAPADNPKLAVAVIVENGKHGTAAAPIARRVLDQFILGKTTTPEIPPPVVKPDGAVDRARRAGRRVACDVRTHRNRLAQPAHVHRRGRACSARSSSTVRCSSAWD